MMKTTFFKKAYAFLKVHTVSFKDADDGLTHVLLHLGYTDRKVALKLGSIKTLSKVNQKYRLKYYFVAFIALLVLRIMKRFQHVSPFLNIFRLGKAQVLEYVLFAEGQLGSESKILTMMVFVLQRES